jgi:hypothetical protein
MTCLRYTESPMSRLIAYSEGTAVSLSFYHCDCGMYFKTLQQKSSDGSMYLCECGRAVEFYGQVVSLWKTRTIESLFGTGWTDVPLAEVKAPVVALDGEVGSPR